ncbi:MAG: DUF4231 domain-containing protein [Anaerolineales bacterium]|nr:DUF4231 domain-containing protein [Anaerolineales bacterium]
MTVQTTQDEVLAPPQEDLPAPPPVQDLPPLETSLTPRQVTFANKNSALVLTPPPETAPADIAAALGLREPSMVLLLLGEAEGLDDITEAYLQQLFSRGIARTAAITETLILDGGRHSGLMAMIGKGVADRGRKSQLIGVAPARKVTESADGTDREPLDPNHSHFVLTDGNEWGDATETMIRLAGAWGPTVPVITILVNGSDETKTQVIEAVRCNWSIIVLKGSDGLADRLAELRQNRSTFILDPDLAEIVSDGNLSIFSLGSAISAFERLLEKLTWPKENLSMETLELAWKTFAMYDANANRQQRSYGRSQTWALILGIVGTLLVLSQSQMELLGYALDESWSENALHIIILLIPISITFIIALGNRFNAGTKWILSRAGAESIKKEIYRYRAQAEIYSDNQTQDVSRELKLTRKIEAVSSKLMQTEVNTSAIKDYTGPVPPKYGAAEGDNGLDYLSPDRYLKLRLQDQMTYYRRKTVELEAQLHRLQWIIYLAGAAGTLLVAIDLELWIALTTTIATSLTTFLQYQKVEEKLMRYNQTATDLMNIHNWWLALSAEEQANPDNIDKLVGQTEMSIHAEHATWVQEMQDALAEMRAEQTKDESTLSTDHKVFAVKR